MQQEARGSDVDKRSAPQPGVSLAPPSLIGRTIDQRYRVEALLGEGGMGLVYRVRHTRLNKPLAIKVLRRENTRDEEVLARFRREAEAASAIGNQHIVDVSDFGMLADGSTYFVMECLEGMDLIEAMDVAKLMDDARVLHIATQICEALGAAHDVGIVHRDLKPENIFLTRQNETDDFVKVLDFGIAKVANGSKRLTRQGEVLGTPHYMSPEQCEGENIDHRADIYALGVLLYEMLTGHVPHDADTMMGILTKHMYEEPIPPKVRVPRVSDELEQVIMRCLEKKPERRYQTMRELEADLERIRTGVRPRGPETVALTPTRPPAGGRRRMSPVYLGGLALVVLMLASTIVIGAREAGDRSGTSTRPTPPAQPLHDAHPETAAMGDERKAEPPSRTVIAEAPEENTRPARRKPPRRKPKPRPEPVDSGGTVILDPWK
jgi:serine/threonine protein kinase